MKKKLALMILLTLAINLAMANVSFAGYVDFPWSAEPPTTETIVVE